MLLLKLYTCLLLDAHVGNMSVLQGSFHLADAPVLMFSNIGVFTNASIKAPMSLPQIW